MSQTLHPLVGTIRIEPGALTGQRLDCDDSTLERLLASFAQRELIESESFHGKKSLRRVASRRLAWPLTAGVDITVRADLAKLLDDLQDEFDQLGSVAP
jgi:hypothetical protein